MDDKFYKLPKSLAARTDITSTEKLIICNLMDRLGDNTVAWPGYDRIGKDLGMTGRAVFNAIHELERKALLIIDRRHGQSNQYQVIANNIRRTFNPEDASDLKELHLNP